MRYNALLSETQFLRVQARAQQMGLSMNLLSINYADNMFVFQTRSQTRPGIIWTQNIQLQGTLRPEDVAHANARTLANMILDRHIKIHCNCEAFLYWGYKYKAWMKGYGLEREIRKPIIRNPNQRGFLCKHLYGILSAWKFYAPSIAQHYKDWYLQNEKKQGN